MNHCHRRAFLKTSIAAFAGLAAQLPQIGCTARKANAHLGSMRDDTPLNWDAFLERVHAEAVRQTEKSWSENDEVVDLFTPPYDADRIARSRWFEVDDEPHEGRAGRFLAKVKG